MVLFTVMTCVQQTKTLLDVLVLTCGEMCLFQFCGSLQLAANANLQFTRYS